MSEKWKNNRIIYEGSVFALKTGVVFLDDGSEAIRDIIVHPGGVVVLPILGEKIVLIKQFRIALGKEIYELPGGRVKAKDNIEERARLELEEEVGYKANCFEHMISYFPVPGMTDLQIHIYKAEDLIHCGTDPECDENIDVVTLNIKEVKELLDSGSIVDGSAIIALSYYFSMQE